MTMCYYNNIWQLMIGVLVVGGVVQPGQTDGQEQTSKAGSGPHEEDTSLIGQRYPIRLEPSEEPIVYTQQWYDKSCTFTYQVTGAPEEWNMDFTTGAGATRSTDLVWACMVHLLDQKSKLHFEYFNIQVTGMKMVDSHVKDANDRNLPAKSFIFDEDTTSLKNTDEFKGKLSFVGLFGKATGELNEEL